MDAVVVGIDVSKDRLDVHVLPIGAAFFVSNDTAGIEDLISRLAELAPALVALEATGGFETLAAVQLGAAGLPAAIVNPAQVRSFADGLGRRAKTDAIDAAVIARFAVATGIEAKPLPGEQTRFLADLVARRRQIMTMIVAEEARLKRALNRPLKKSIARLLAALRRELASIDADLDAQIRNRPGASRKTSCPPCQVWARLSRAPSLPNCPSLAVLIAGRSRRWSGLLPSPGSPANGAATASSPEAEPACAPPSSWALSWPPVTTRC